LFYKEKKKKNYPRQEDYSNEMKDEKKRENLNLISNHTTQDFREIKILTSNMVSISDFVDVFCA